MEFNDCCPNCDCDAEFCNAEDTYLCPNCDSQLFEKENTMSDITSTCPQCGSVIPYDETRMTYVCKCGFSSPDPELFFDESDEPDEPVAEKKVRAVIELSYGAIQTVHFSVSGLARDVLDILVDRGIVHTAIANEYRFFAIQWNLAVNASREKSVKDAIRAAAQANHYRVTIRVMDLTE